MIDSINRVSFQKMIIVAVAPIGVVTVCILAWHIIFKIDSCLDRRKKRGSIIVPKCHEDYSPRASNAADMTVLQLD